MHTLDVPMDTRYPYRMLMTEWAARRQLELDAERVAKKTNNRGVYSELQRKTGLNRKTIVRAARDGDAVNYESAEKLSRATGGEVSIDELRFPKGKPAEDDAAA